MAIRILPFYLHGKSTRRLNMFPGGFQTEEVVTPSRLLHLNEGFSDLGKNEP
jgi:hypothetical protein